MKLPNIRSINIQSIKDAIANKKKNFIIILILAVILVVGFSTGGVIYRGLEDEDIDDIKLNRPEIGGIVKTQPESQPQINVEGTGTTAPVTTVSNATERRTAEQQTINPQRDTKEQHSIDSTPIITTNKSFEQWADIFSDTILSSAIIDRVAHHCSIIKINGQSYRTKNLKRKGGDIQ